MGSSLNVGGTDFEVLRMLDTTERVETWLARARGHEELRVLRVVHAGADTERFLASCQRLSELHHPGLLPVIASGRLDERRTYVLTAYSPAPPLNEHGPLPADARGKFAPVADGLAALHDAGLRLGSGLSASRLFVGDAALLDPSLAGLAEPDASPAGDVRTLVATLSGYGLTLGEPSAPDAPPLQPLEAVTDAHVLSDLLADAAGQWRARTAMSGKHPAFVPPEADPDLTGTALGPWQLERVLGEGAMGRVYLGRHSRIGREAAVKVLKAEHARQADSVQRFIQEATAVNAIKNEHIVEVSDFGEQERPDGRVTVYCVMELLEGRSLTAALWAEPFTVSRAARVARDLSLALHAAHAVGVVHRDVKPDNVWLQRRGHGSEFVKVLDFGVAKLLKPLGDLKVGGTQAGMVIGTPDYMAPEQALGAPSDFRVDLWAVGVVLYELLTGRRPYVGETFQALLIELATRPPEPMGELTRGGEPIPQALQDVVAWCLSREPGDRPPSGEALASALEAFVGPEPAFVAPAQNAVMSAPPSRPGSWRSATAAARANAGMAPTSASQRQATPFPPGFSPLPSAPLEPGDGTDATVVRPITMPPGVITAASGARSTLPPGAVGAGAAPSTLPPGVVARGAAPNTVPPGVVASGVAPITLPPGVVASGAAVSTFPPGNSASADTDGAQTSSHGDPPSGPASTESALAAGVPGTSQHRPSSPRPPASPARTTHTPLLAAGGAFGLLLIAALGWMLFKPRPVPAPPPAVEPTARVEALPVVPVAPAPSAEAKAPQARPSPEALLRPALPPKPAEPEHWLAITSTPPGAAVRDRHSDQVLGTTPLRVAMTERDSLPLELTLEGYRPLTKDLPFTDDATLDLTLEALPKRKVAAPTKTATPQKVAPAKKATLKKGTARDRIVDPFKH